MSKVLLLMFVFINGSEHKIGQIGGFVSLQACQSFANIVERKLNHPDTDLENKKIIMKCVVKNDN